MITGYEGATFSELERTAVREQNNLALEVIERIARQDATLFQKAFVLKPRTTYTDGSSS